jgi:hypothetical protein
VNAPDTLNPQPPATSGPTHYRPHGRLIDDAEQFARKNRSRRSTFLKWLRKVHGWIGLWGALLGLLFGMTGFLLNHRAPPLRISTGEPQVSQMQMQPEQWSVMVASPGGSVMAEYWVGNNFVSVKRTENTVLAMMTNLHKGVGLSVGWVLLIDTFAGSIVLLSLTGVLLWTELNKKRTAGVVIVATSLIAAIVCGLM